MHYVYLRNNDLILYYYISISVFFPAMDYSYLNQAGFDPSSAMSSLQSAAAASAVVSSEANFYSDLSGSCPSTAAAAAMMPSYYGSLGMDLNEMPIVAIFGHRLFKEKFHQYSSRKKTKYLQYRN